MPINDSNDDPRPHIYKWAVIATLISNAILFSMAIHLAQSTGNANWYWMLVLGFILGPSDVAELAYKKLYEERQ